MLTCVIFSKKPRPKGPSDSFGWTSRLPTSRLATWLQNLFNIWTYDKLVDFGFGFICGVSTNTTVVHLLTIWCDTWQQSATISNCGFCPPRTSLTNIDVVDQILTKYQAKRLTRDWQTVVGIYSKRIPDLVAISSTHSSAMSIVQLIQMQQQGCLVWLCDEDFMVKALQCIVSLEERVLVILALVVQEKMTLVLGDFDFGSRGWWWRWWLCDLNLFWGEEGVAASQRERERGTAMTAVHTTCQHCSMYLENSAMYTVKFWTAPCLLCCALFEL